MSDDVYIWISRWEEFQHYKPDRDRPPAWIKSYTKQLSDARYLGLTDRQRALLHDLRHVFAVAGRQLGRDVAAIARHRHRQTFRSDLEALNHAGFIEFISREALEKRLEALYSTSPLEVEGDKEPPYPRRRGGTKPSQRATTKPPRPRVDPTPEPQLPPPEERHRLAAELRAQLLGAQAAAAANGRDLDLPPELQPEPKHSQ